jgi:ribosomal protein S18 acetylase RimI-like enzyme
MYEDYNYVIIGAYNDNQIIGYIIFSISDTIEILKIFVKEEFIKKGIVKQLIDYVANNNVQDIFLEVSSSNINAINFYLKLNFKQINIRKKYYDDGSDAIILVRKS